MSDLTSTNASVPFKSLCYGARFCYVGSDRIWVKVGPDLIAEWDPALISANWIGQALCSFSNDGDVTTVVNVLPELPITSQAPSHLTREQQIAAMADILRSCRWFKTPDGVPEDKHLIWARDMWEAANPSQSELPRVKPLEWGHPSSIPDAHLLVATLLGQMYTIKTSRMIDNFKLNTPDGADYYPDIEAAKEAAQIDIERRVGAVYIRPGVTDQQEASSAAVHAHTLRKAARREEDNGNSHLAEELRAAMRFVEQCADAKG